MVELRPTGASLLVVDKAGSVMQALNPCGARPKIAYTSQGYHAGEDDSGQLAFNGEFFEPTLAGYLLGNGARLYRPALARFCSLDSLSPFGAGGLNATAYCSGDPVNFSDPTGHVPLTHYVAKLISGRSMMPGTEQLVPGVSTLKSQALQVLIDYWPAEHAINLVGDAQVFKRLIEPARLTKFQSGVTRAHDATFQLSTQQFHDYMAPHPKQFKYMTSTLNAYNYMKSVTRGLASSSFRFGKPKKGLLQFLGLRSGAPKLQFPGVRSADAKAMRRAFKPHLGKIRDRDFSDLNAYISEAPSVLALRQGLSGRLQKELVDYYGDTLGQSIFSSFR